MKMKLLLRKDELLRLKEQKTKEFSKAEGLHKESLALELYGIGKRIDEIEKILSILA